VGYILCRPALVHGMFPNMIQKYDTKYDTKNNNDLCTYDTYRKILKYREMLLYARVMFLKKSRRFNTNSHLKLYFLGDRELTTLCYIVNDYASGQYTVYTHPYTIYLFHSNAIKVYGTTSIVSGMVHIHSFWYGSQMLYFLT
jgi:hypothetical protein